MKNNYIDNYALIECLRGIKKDSYAIAPKKKSWSKRMAKWLGLTNNNPFKRDKRSILLNELK